jgi:hypothetical protein
MRTLNRKQLIVLLVLVLCLLGLSIFQTIQSYSIDGKTLSKTWTGATDSVHNIVITVGGQQVWNTLNLPANKSMSFTPLLHGTSYTITWTDVWGPHSESGTVDCDQDNVARVVNDIPTPKSIE